MWGQERKASLVVSINFACYSLKDALYFHCDVTIIYLKLNTFSFELNRNLRLINDVGQQRILKQ